METLVILNKKLTNNKFVKSYNSLELCGVEVVFGIIDTYNKISELLPHQVQIKVKAISCNFRDKANMLKFNEIISNERGEKPIYSPFGSEFAGEVVQVGCMVDKLNIGDMVIANNNYRPNESTVYGIPTNFSSQRLIIINENQLIKIPISMPIEKAACFSMGSQTAYSMIRKVKIKKHDKILLASATSNTSLFILNILKSWAGVKIYTMTNRNIFDDRLEETGATKSLNRNNIEKFAKDIGGFDVVIDPFCDINFSSVIKHINFNGRYITCGLYGQHYLYDKLYNNSIKINDIISHVIINNINIIGSCLGDNEDIYNALDDFKNNKYDITIDSIWTGNQYIQFINRTFNDYKRFGKVLYIYND